MYSQNDLLEIRAAFSASIQSPPYIAPIELTIDSGVVQQGQFNVPSGSEFSVTGLQIEYEPEDDGTCELFIRLRSVSSQTLYTNGFVRISLIATPGRSTDGTRFGMLPFFAMVPAEDGIIAEVRNSSLAQKKVSIAAVGKRYLRLSNSEKQQILNSIMG